MSKAAVARKGKVMHIPGISKKAVIRFPKSSEMLNVVMFMLFQISLAGTGARNTFLQDIRGTNTVNHVSPDTGFTQYSNSVGSMITTQLFVVTIICFAVSFYGRPLIRSTKIIPNLIPLLVAFVIAIIATLSLPTQGNHLNETFPKWASERYGIELNPDDSSFFAVDKGLLKDKNSTTVYQMKEVDDKFYLYTLEGTELPKK